MLRRRVPRTSLALVARVLLGVVVWAPGRVGCLCNGLGLYAVLSSGVDTGIVFRASFKLSRMAARRGGCVQLGVGWSVVQSSFNMISDVHSYTD